MVRALRVVQKRARGKRVGGRGVTCFGLRAGNSLAINEKKTKEGKGYGQEKRPECREP